MLKLSKPRSTTPSSVYQFVASEEGVARSSDFSLVVVNDSGYEQVQEMARLERAGVEMETLGLTLAVMNGAESLVGTLVASGIEVCFANPGTSEIHFVAALDKINGMRAILCLFEGVVTGAADGYGRMAEKPACTLLHLVRSRSREWLGKSA